MANIPVEIVAVETGDSGATLSPQSQVGPAVELAGLSAAVGVMSAAGQPVSVLQAQPVIDVVRGDTAGSGGTPSLPATLKQIAFVKTHSSATIEQSRMFDSFSEHIATVLMEVYRCRVCNFHTTSKGLIVTHLMEKHTQALSKESMSNPDNPRERVRGMQLLLAPVAVPRELQQCVTRGLSSQAISNGSAKLPRCTNSAPRTDCKETGMAMSDSDSDGGDGFSDDASPTNSSPPSTVANALELLMAIGHEKDLDVSKPKESTEAGQAVERIDPGPPVAAGLVSIAASGVVGSQPGGRASRDLGLMTSPGTGQAKGGSLLTVNEEELAKTLEIDEKKGSERVAGVAEAGDCGGSLPRKPDILSGATILKPIPIQIGLGSTVPTIDIQEIANTASKSNPKATTITVLHHGQGNEPPTAIQFKKSKKSKAVIPTGESLGITSPFSNRSSYRGNKQFSCGACHARYKSVAELDRHVKKKHQRSRKYLCEICGEALATRASVKYHVSKKHAVIQKIFRCSSCDYRTPFDARMAIHQATHQSEFVCSLCNKSYVSAERLKKHYSSPLHKNALNPLVCEHCGYSTKKRDNFLVHMRKHTGEKPYKCKVCDYASADGSTLKKHVMAKHSTIRPFKCPSCPFSCVDKKGLDIHARKHTGERPFKCQLCLYAAKRRSALNVHLQTHSKDGAAAGKRQKGKAGASLPTEVASYETVGQVSATAQQTPQQTQEQQQYTTMANYQHATLVSTPVTPQAVEGEEAILQAKPMTGDADTTQDSYSVQLAPSCIAKPVQTIWQSM